MNAVEKLAVMLQDAKSFMEKNGAPSPSGFDGKPALRRIYRAISSTIYDLEELAGVDAAALRDARDEAAHRLADGTTLCQCTDPGCSCEGKCHLLPIYHLVRVGPLRYSHRVAQRDPWNVLPSKKVQMCEHCGEDAMKSGVFAVDHTGDFV